MLLSAAILTTLALHAAPPATGDELPDESQLFKTGNAKPDILLLIDASCSMGYEPRSAPMYSKCTYFRTDPNGFDAGGGSFWKWQQVQAVLTGCESADDGILDKWSSKVRFAIRAFGSDCDDWGGSYCKDDELLANFGASLSTLETAVRSNRNVGNTPMTDGTLRAGQDFVNFFDGKTGDDALRCRKKAIVALTDGMPNDSHGSFDYRCDGVDFSSGSRPPADASAWLYQAPSLFCSTPGNELEISSYAIGFEVDGSTFTTIDNYAKAGGGKAFLASSAEDLDAAFNDIIQTIVGRSAVVFSRGANARAGLFTGNVSFAASFRPETTGAWSGNLKRYCVFPKIEASGTYGDETECIYKRKSDTQKGILVSNPAVVDQWSSASTPTTCSSSSDCTDIESCVAGQCVPGTLAGGMGEILRGVLADGDGKPEAVSGNYLHRRIYTWRSTPNPTNKDDPRTLAAGFVEVNDETGDFGPSDVWVPPSKLAMFVNRLHGYTCTVDGEDACADISDWTKRPAPPAVGKWPVGDFMHMPTVLLRYRPDADDDSSGTIEHDEVCNTAGDCIVVVGGNDGMLHFVDATTGNELSALIPAELFKPNNVSRWRLDTIDDVSVVEPHKYFLDGGLRLYHDDQDGDGVISGIKSNPKIMEPALLVFSLGRGGRAMYVMDVRKLRSNGGRPKTGETDVYPIMPVRDSADNPDQAPDYEFDNLENMLESPWLGPINTGSAKVPVAVFGTGHVRAYDKGDLDIPSAYNDGTRVRFDTRTAPCSTALQGWNDYLNDYIAKNYPPLLQLAVFGDTLVSPLDMCTILAQGYVATTKGLQIPYEFLEPYIADASSNLKPPGPLVGPAGTVAQRVCFSSVSIEQDEKFGDEFLAVSSHPASALTHASVVTGAGVGLTSQYYWAEDLERVTYSASHPTYPSQTFDCSNWVYDRNLSVLFHINLNGASNSRFTISHMEYVQEVLPKDGYRHDPGVYVVGLVDGDSNVTFNGARPFTTAPSDENVLVQFRYNCDDKGNDIDFDGVVDADGSYSNCIDAKTSGFEVLREFQCPVASEITVVPGADGTLRDLYFGDLCGTIWHIEYAYPGKDLVDAWRVRRILSTNHNPDAIGTPLLPTHGDGLTVQSQYLRKFFTKIDAAPSTCPGKRVTALLFGTGNVQAPLHSQFKNSDFANDFQANPSGCNGGSPGANCGKDVMGVIFYDPTEIKGGGDTNPYWDGTLTVAEALFNATSATFDPSSPGGKKGWFIKLADKERMPRDPIALEGIAYFKTFSPQADPSECTSASGQEFNYAIRLCTSKPIGVDTDGDGSVTLADRVASTTSADIGGDLQIMTPRVGRPFVTTGALDGDEAALVGGTQFTRMPVLNWRYPSLKFD